MTANNQPIIVIKKKKHHAGHHGGAWKVAYADFVTAMMAFFLVMWLVTQSKQVKAAIGGYFREPAMFEGGGKGILTGGTGLNEEAPGEASKAETSAQSERKLLEDAVRHMQEQIDQVPAFKTLGKQVEFKVTPEGLRIDLVEQSDSSFFDAGSASLRGEAEHLLGVIAHEVGAVGQEVVIEGHTDSLGYASDDHYSNWELSADRANAARRVMEREGLKPSQISSIRGMADRQPRMPDPRDPRNRRVSILVKNPLMATAAAAPDEKSPAPQ